VLKSVVVCERTTAYLRHVKIQDFARLPVSLIRVIRADPRPVIERGTADRMFR
jgi:hypothetical protein